jgi:hypothetical protein
MSADRVEKQVFIYPHDQIVNSRSLSVAESEDQFTLEESEFAIDLGLEKWALQIEAPDLKHVVCMYLEDWEPAALKKQHDTSDVRLGQKYEGLQFIDPDHPDQMYTIEPRMELGETSRVLCAGDLQIGARR